MTNYLFLLTLYLGLTATVYLYPKKLQKRNHITNAILMALFLVLVEPILIPEGVILTISGIIDLAISKLPKSDDISVLATNIPKLKENFILSLAVPIGFFIIGRIVLYFNKISLNTFDTLYTGLFPFVVYFNFIIFLGIDGLGGLIWHYILFFIVYAVVSMSRIQFFMFFGIKSILDDRDLNQKDIKL